MRKPRIILRGATYFVRARTNHDHNFLGSNKAKVLLRKTFRDTISKFSFCWKKLRINPNGIEVRIRPGQQEVISKIMQYFLGVFAQRYNRANGLWGHFWGDRFQSKVIDRSKEKRSTASQCSMLRKQRPLLSLCMQSSEPLFLLKFILSICFPGYT
jgi:REP element-mobilizing transposase RayT